jgi:hypothetical protein
MIPGRAELWRATGIRGVVSAKGQGRILEARLVPRYASSMCTAGEPTSLKETSLPRSAAASGPVTLVVPEPAPRLHVVVIGGGFRALAPLKTVARQAAVRAMLIDRRNRGTEPT